MNSLKCLRATLASAVLVGACSAESTGGRADEQEHLEDSQDESPEKRAGTLDAGDRAARDGEIDSGGRRADSEWRAVDAGSAPADAGLVKPIGTGLPCDVQGIVGERCGLCHGNPPAFGAYMALTTEVEFHAPSTTDATKSYFELAKVRINASANRMPPSSAAQLSASELATLNAWLDRGAPASEERCGPSSTGAGDGGTGPAGDPGAIDTGGLDCHRFLAHAPGDKNAKFEVGVAVDAHYIMSFKAPWEGARYAQVIQPVIDNTKALHHWLLYEEAGTDGAVEPTLGAHPGGTMVAGWAPGGTPYDFRKFGDVGLELPGTSYLLELHYNSSDPSAFDASGVEICLSKSKPEHVAGNAWVGYDNSILAGDLGGPRTTWTGVCAHQSQEPIHFLYISPHMHQSGRHLKSTITSPDGATRVLHDLPFEFAYQISYESSEVLMPGEIITTTCTYSSPQSFGTTTAEEMCYLFVYSYPKGALTDNGVWGAFAHGEGVCLGQ